MMPARYDDEGNLETGTYIETCKKCHGRGKFVSWSGRTVGTCFACKGKGQFERKTSPEVRAKARAANRARKERNTRENIDFFTEKHPEAMGWIKAKAASFGFATAMLDAVMKYGELTERQMETVERLMKQDAERQAAREQEKKDRVENAPEVKNTDALMKAFDEARESGLKRLKMRFDGFEVSPASATSKNAGALYVKAGSAYLGKIMGGKFLSTRDCSPAMVSKVAETMADPLAAAVLYGKQTGICSCCGRELTDPRSIEAGIGPICQSKWGL